MENTVRILISSYNEKGIIKPIKEYEIKKLIYPLQLNKDMGIKKEVTLLLDKLPNTLSIFLSGKSMIKEKIKLICSAIFGIQFLMMYGNKAFAANSSGTDTTSLWGEMMPIFNLFQDIIMVVGALAIFGGLVLMMFKKQAGKKFLMSTIVIVAACYIVPAGLMLLGIIGGMINDTLISVFQNSNLKDSVNVNK